MTKAEQFTIDRPSYADHPEFTPSMSPKAVLAAGVFDGGYFHGWGAEQLEGIDQDILDAGPYQEKPDARAHNAFGVHCGLGIDEWRRKGWIQDQDPVGWFQWYARFHCGRRSEDDARQIARWTDFARRWQPKTVEALERMNPQAKSRQALLHWAQDPYGPERNLGLAIDTTA